MSDEMRRPPALHGGENTDDGLPPDVSPQEAARWVALARQVAGAATAGDELLLQGWFAEDPSAAAEVRALAGMIDRAGQPPVPELNVEAALARVRERRTGSVRTMAPPGRRAAREEGMRRFVLPSLRAAAAILVLASGTLVWRIGSRERSASPARFVSRIGTLDTVNLRDGTKVVLAPGSILEAAAGFGEPRREVTLTGQAFFEVRHDAAHPFTVRVGQAVVEDIGTRFSVRSGKTGPVVVSVAEGSVKLQLVDARGAAAPSHTGVVLAAGDRGSLSALGGAQVERGVNPETEFAWTRGELVFRDAPLPEVAAEIQRWYGVRVEVDPLLAPRHVTASFHGESPAEVLRVIGIVLGARVEQHGGTVNLRPGMP